MWDTKGYHRQLTCIYCLTKSPPEHRLSRFCTIHIHPLSAILPQSVLDYVCLYVVVLDKCVPSAVNPTADMSGPHFASYVGPFSYYKRLYTTFVMLNEI